MTTRSGFGRPCGKARLAPMVMKSYTPHPDDAQRCPGDCLAWERIPRSLRQNSGHRASGRSLRPIRRGRRSGIRAPLRDGISCSFSCSFSCSSGELPPDSGLLPHLEGTDWRNRRSKRRSKRGSKKLGLHRSGARGCDILPVHHIRSSATAGTRQVPPRRRTVSPGPLPLPEWVQCRHVLLTASGDRRRR